MTAMARTAVVPVAAPVGTLSALRRSSRPSAVGCADDTEASISGTNLRPDGRRLTPNMPFQRLEVNTCGVPQEEFAVPDVARKHRVRGVAGLLPDLERGDTCPRRTRREAGAQAVARIPGRVEPCGRHPVAKDQRHGFAGESARRDMLVLQPRSRDKVRSSSAPASRLQPNRLRH